MILYAIKYELAIVLVCYQNCIIKVQHLMVIATIVFEKR